jgi:alkylated DNA repair protein (DNA oxidative demethylase)
VEYGSPLGASNGLRATVSRFASHGPYGGSETVVCVIGCQLAQLCHLRDRLVFFADSTSVQARFLNYHNAMNLDLFGEEERLYRWREDLYQGAVVLRRYALTQENALLAAVDSVVAVSPWREALTPGGLKMSVLVTGCGAYGMANEGDYGMRSVDPLTGRRWPPMPAILRELGINAAAEAGFPEFLPNMAHINRYGPGAKLGMHQDRGENDTLDPIVSVSLGLPATFKMGGFQRSDKSVNVSLLHGDVVVWGGPSRMRFHGVLPVKPGAHPFTGEARINLTIRKMK